MPLEIVDMLVASRVSTRGRAGIRFRDTYRIATESNSTILRPSRIGNVVPEIIALGWYFKTSAR